MSKFYERAITSAIYAFSRFRQLQRLTSCPKEMRRVATSVSPRNHPWWGDYLLMDLRYICAKTQLLVLFTRSCASVSFRTLIPDRWRFDKSPHALSQETTNGGLFIHGYVGYLIKNEIASAIYAFSLPSASVRFRMLHPARMRCDKSPQAFPHETIHARGGMGIIY